MVHRRGMALLNPMPNFVPNMFATNRIPLSKLETLQNCYFPSRDQNLQLDYLLLKNPSSFARTRWSPSLMVAISSMYASPSSKTWVGVHLNFWAPSSNSSSMESGKKMSFEPGSFSGQLIVTRVRLSLAKVREKDAVVLRWLSPAYNVNLKPNTTVNLRRVKIEGVGNRYVFEIDFDRRLATYGATCVIQIIRHSVMIV